MPSLPSIVLTAANPAESPRGLEFARERRFDIDGLRGMAALSVLALHCFPAWSHDSLIGIHMLFVLSGYLVTRRLLDAGAAQAGLAAFYASRIRRVVPALCLVLLFCLVFSLLFASPELALAVGRQVGWGALFVTDIVAWRDPGMLDAPVFSQPLTHLWQLAIIVQFCLVWPAVVLTSAHRPRQLVWIAAGSLVASLTLQLLLAADDPAAAYFLPWSRWWELMAGALLASWHSLRDGIAAIRSRPVISARLLSPRPAVEVMAWGGLSILALALALASGAAQGSVLWAVLPVIGSVLLLAAGPQTWVNRQLLSHPVLRFYGLIAYPLLLWHWPLLTFPPLLGVALTTDVRVVILLASVVLAALTYELIDKPLLQMVPSPRLSRVLLGALALVGVLGWVVVSTDGLSVTYPTSMRSLGH